MKEKTIYFFSLMLLTFSCTKDIDDILVQNFNNETGIIQLSQADKIDQDSELFENLVQITTDEERADKNITCINFDYPLSIFVLDDTDQFVSLNAVLDDEEFSELLENISADFQSVLVFQFPLH